jgi:hypothetical protein
LPFEGSPEAAAVTPEYKQSQREAKLAPKRIFLPVLERQGGMDFLRLLTGKVYFLARAGNRINTQVKVKKKAGRRLRRRILAHAENAIAAMKQAEQPTA